MGRASTRIAALAIAAGAVAAALPAAAASRGGHAPPAWAADEQEYVPRELVVVYEDGVSSREQAAIRREERARLVDTVPIPGQNVDVVKLKPGESVPGAADEFEDDHRGEIAYAEPNYIYSADQLPNDPYFASHLWGFNNTGQTVNGFAGTPDADFDGPEGWDIATGSDQIVVGVADSGVDGTHPDLKDNMWRNGGEFGGGRESNKKDDDGNGLVDDWQGWDFADNDNDPMDKHSHGTHVAGTIGAVGNNGVGVTGVAWTVKLMPVKVLSDKGFGSNAGIAAGFAYASKMGAHVVNASLGGPGGSQLINDAIKAAKDKTLFAVAAGNESQDLGKEPSYPCSFGGVNLVCVGATAPDDSLANFSNYNENVVDIAAPGVNIYSTTPGDRYAFKNGTSMATPAVAGVAALLYSLQPAANAGDTKKTLLTLYDEVPDLAGKIAKKRRLGLPNAKAPKKPDKPVKRPEPPPAEPPHDEPTYPDPADPGAPPPDVGLLFPIWGTPVVNINITIINGYVGNVNQAYMREIIFSWERRTGSTCSYLTDVGMLEHDCGDPLYLSAGGTDSWSYDLSRVQKASMKAGTYTFRVRLITTEGESLLLDERTIKVKGKSSKKRKKPRRRRR